MHTHSHPHHHPHTPPHSFNFAFTLAVTLNLAFTLTEFILALVADSMSLLSDAAHNFGDVFGLVLAWGANWLLSLPARKRYSYGFKRTTILASLANAGILIASAAVIAYESIYKLFHISQVNETIVIVAAAIGIVINGGTALLFVKGAHEDLNIKSAFLHLLADALISIGVVITGVLIYYTQLEWLDPLVGILIVFTILWGMWGLLRDSLRLILDAVPHYIDFSGVKKFLLELPGVVTIHDLHIWGLSTREVALTVHLVLNPNQVNEVDYKHINHTLKDKFKIHHATVQVEMENSDFLCVRTESC